MFAMTGPSSPAGIPAILMLKSVSIRRLFAESPGKTIFRFCSGFVDANEDPPVFVHGNSKIINRGQGLGYDARFGLEFEWFNFRETPQSLADKSYVDPKPITPGMFGYSVQRPSLNQGFFRDIMEQLEAFRVPVEGLHTETGPGVTEAAIANTDALEAADRAVLFKSGVKEIAYRHDMVASFMAKWNESLPGCSGHLHQSLWMMPVKTFFTTHPILIR